MIPATDTGLGAVVIRLLGQFEVRAGDVVVVDGGWPRSKARAMLKVLALERGRTLRREELTHMLWPDLDAAAASNNFHKNVHYLRTAFATHELRNVISVTDENVALHPDVRTDVDAFGEAARRARAARADIVLYEEALAAYRGNLLIDDLDVQRFEGRRDQLAELRALLLRELGQLLLLRGRREQAIDRLRELLDVDPTDEDGHRLLMRSYAASGRRARAIEQYERCRAVLRDELGVAPTPETEALHRELEDGSAVSDGDVPWERDEAFIGRIEELDVLRGQMTQSAAGRGGLAVLSGAPGSGKTRTCEEFALYARLAGARVVWGRCYEGDGAPALWPWRQALGEIVRMDGAATASAKDVRSAAGVIPEIAATTTDDGGHGTERFRAFAAIAAILREFAKARPLLIVLDDLQGADEPSLLLLQFVANELGNSRVMILGTYRDAGNLRPLARTLVELERRAGVSRMQLDGLTAKQVGEFAESVRGAPVPPTLVERIHDATNGNPLFVREMVLFLAAKDGLGTEATTALADTSPALREMIRLRIEKLSAPCQRLLAVAAVAGRNVDVALLRRVVRPRKHELAGAIGEAEGQGIMAPLGADGARATFTHALFQEVIYDDLPLAERTELHRKWGDALEPMCCTQGRSYISEIARHYAEAARGGDVDAFANAIQFTRRAADEATGMLAWEEAIRLLEQALDLMALGKCADEVARCDVLLALCRTRKAAGDSAGARDAALRCADLARRLRLGDRLALVGIYFAGPWANPLGVDPVVVSILEDALDLLGPDDSPLRAWMLARLGYELLYSAGRDRAPGLIHDALAMARRTGDPGAIAIAIDKYLNIAVSAERVADQLALADEMRRLAEASSSPELTLIARCWRIDKLLQLGHVGAAWAEQAVHAQEAAESRKLPYLWPVASMRMMKALFEARLADAEECLGAAARAAAAAGALDATYVLGAQTMLLRLEQGRLAEFEPVVAGIAATTPNMVGFRAALAFVHAEIGDIEAARHDLQLAAADDLHEVRCTMHLLATTITIVMLAEACLALGDAERARALYDLLLPYAPYNVTVPNGACCVGSASRTLGVLAANMRDWDAANRHFEEALRMNEASGAPSWLARAQVDYADMLAARGAPGDADRGAALLDAAGTLSRESGLTGLQSRIAGPHPRYPIHGG